MIIDVIILLPWVVFGALGFRDASVRKLSAIATCILAMFLSQWLMHDLGTLMQDKLHVLPEDAPVLAFAIIFFFTLFLQSILYRFLTGNYKIGGIVDRIGGVALGLVQGGIVISVVIFIFAMQEPPSEKTTRDSRLYGTTASFAPRIMDLFSSTLSTAGQSMRDVASPGSRDLDSLKKEDVESFVSPGAAKVDSTLRAPRR
jgi:uncharacterized membrane protein required for colicin V production